MKIEPRQITSNKQFTHYCMVGIFHRYFLSVKAELAVDEAEGYDADKEITAKVKSTSTLLRRIKAED